MKLALITIGLVTALLPFDPIQAQTPALQKAQDALELDYRSEADRARDGNRSPLKALEIMGLEHDMRVFEFAPGNGWYTKILAPVLQDEGELSIGYPAPWLQGLADMLQAPQMDRVRQVVMDMDWDAQALVYTFNSIDFQTEELDLFLNIREYHNLSATDRKPFNQAVYRALKPGGRYVVIDHTRRHMQADSPENWRREDPVKVLLEIQQAGFELMEQSDLFYRPDDSLQYEVGRKSVTGNTDRFFFVFRKPG